MNSYLIAQTGRIRGQIGGARSLHALCVALLLSAVSSRAATLTVTNTNDSGTGSLREAIAAATNGDTIVFSLPLPSTITLTSGGLGITQNITIAGPGPANLAIDGNSNGTVLSVSASAVISGLTITNGYTPSEFSGGGISATAPMLTLTNVAVTGNSSSYEGGGIYYGGFGTLSLINCTVSGNSAGTNGAGGGVALEDEYMQAVQIVGSTISGNTASQGGGLYINANGPEPILAAFAMTNTTISGNLALSEGGGMCIISDGGVFPMQFSNVIFGSNSAVFGGGIYAEKASGFSMANLSFTGNFASKAGGGLCNAYCGSVLSNATFSGNSAALGGAVGLVTGGYGGGAGVVLYNSLVISNAASNGGGVWVIADSFPTDANVFNSTFAHNVATNAGGAIFNSASGSAGSVEVVGSTFSANSAAIGGATYCEAQAGIYGIGDTEVGITNSTFSGNTAATGGAIYNFCNYTPPPNGSVSATVQIFNSTFSANSAINGGFLFNTNDGPGTASVLIGSSIINSGPVGGTILNVGGTVTSSGYNLSSDAAGGALTNGTDLNNTDPKLGPLQDNGGTVFTHALLPGSPAINQGYNFSGLTNDGRGLGFLRTYEYPGIPNALNGDGTDIGAFELQPATTDFATWQLQYFGCTNCPQSAPGADPDGDGANNMNEFLAGTNPRNSASVFRVLSLTPQGNDLLVTWQTAGGHTNVLQSSGGLANGSFSDISPAIVIPGTGDATNSYLETGAAQNGTNSFHRVRLGQ